MRLVLLLVLLSIPAAEGLPSPTHVYFTAVGDVGMTANSKAVLDRLAQADADLHFTVGDLSYGVTGQEQAFCDMVTARVGPGFPFELLAGNHESNGQNGHINDFSACLPNQLPGLVGTYGRQYYVDVPAADPLVRYVMISPALPYPDGTWTYTAGDARYEWTRAAIDGARAAGIPWVVLGMHKSCLSTGEKTCEPGRELVDMLIAKKVDLVVNGHEHFYQRTKQLTLGAGCPSLVIGGYDADCVRDADNDVIAGAGTVFVTVGTGGVQQRDLVLTDPELPYFAASAGANQNMTYGLSGFDVTPDRIAASFLRGSGGTFTDAFTITKQAGVNAAPSASFTSSTSGLTASFDGSSSTDPDGTVVLYEWRFGDGSTDVGRTPQHTYAAAGTYPVRLTVTDDRGATATVVRDVTVTAPVGTVVAADAFERAVSLGWGAADVGGTWTTNGTASASSGRGRLTVTKPGASASAYLPNASAAGAEVTAEVALDRRPAGTGAYVDSGVILRRSSGNNYRALVRFMSNGSVRAALYRSLSGGGSGTVGSLVTVSGLTYAVGDTLEVRGQVTGRNPTTLRLKVWKKGTPEPTAWTSTGTDTAAALQAAGSLGFTAYVPSAVTNAPVQFAYDDLRATPLP